jgi:hypothetical protein
MPQSQRNTALLTKMRAYTAKHTSSKAAAERALVREGFVLKNGEAAPAFAPEREKA